MNENKNGYWIYSTSVVGFFIVLIAFIFWLTYSLIIKLATSPITNEVIIRTLITLIITVFVGGYFSKWLEHKKAKKLELYKIQTSVSIKVIDYATEYFYHPQREDIKDLLIAESNKVKLYFDDQVLLSINDFIEAKEPNRKIKYQIIIDNLQKHMK